MEFKGVNSCWNISFILSTNYTIGKIIRENSSTGGVKIHPACAHCCGSIHFCKKKRVKFDAFWSVFCNSYDILYDIT